jgi:2-aminoadipate transaminase
MGLFFIHINHKLTMGNYTKPIDLKYSDRIQQVPRSFIRDILKVASSPEIISFAGGLPNRKYFPVKELSESTARVMKNQASTALQYSLTSGLPKLREIIATFYTNQGLNIPIENILITTGSQQALDLIGKTFINEGDTVLLEEPSYLGAIQAFSMYRPKFKAIELQADGINIEKWEEAIKHDQPKFTYMIPNFQNPTGISYSLQKRKEVAKRAIENNSLLIEDDPYGKIRFSGEHLPNIFSLAPNNTILLGSFSKIIVPGFRLGWVIADKKIINKLEVAKQAADLHTDVFVQHIVIDFLKHNDLNTHLNKILKAYKTQADSICDAMAEYLPENFTFTKPQGGMFTWVTMPNNYSSLKVFNEAQKRNMAFVPGVPFYIDRKDASTMRLNFSCSEPNIINEGIKRLAKAIEQLYPSKF